MKTQSQDVHRSTIFIARDKQTWVPAQNNKKYRNSNIPTQKTQSHCETKSQDEETHTRGRFQRPARLVCTWPDHLLLSQ